MNNRIVTETCKSIRKLSRETLKGKWFKLFASFFIYFILANGIAAFLDSIFFIENPAYSPDIDYISENLAYGGTIYRFITGGAFELGIVYVMIKVLRHGQCDERLVFEGFSHYLKAFLLTLYIGVKILLWSFLLLVPGIVAYFRYSQAYYILAEHPDYSIIRCVDESKKMMMGNKERLCLLIISYVGWFILGLIPASVGEAAYGGSGIINFLLSWMLYIPEMFAIMYMQMGKTTFYGLLTDGKVLTEDAELLKQ